MSQNLIHLSLDDAQFAAVDGALTALEAALSGPVALDTDERKGLSRMSAKSEQFCRQTLALLCAETAGRAAQPGPVHLTPVFGGPRLSAKSVGAARPLLRYLHLLRLLHLA